MILRSLNRSEKWKMATMTRKNMSTIYTKLHPITSSNLEPEELSYRALLVALGLVYYVRLNTSHRKKFEDELDKNQLPTKLTFHKAFTEEVATCKAIVSI